LTPIKEKWPDSLLAFTFPSCLKLNQAFFNLLFCICFVAFGAMIRFLDQVIIYEIIGKVNPMEPKGKIVDELEIFVRAAFT
jgi:hypothetical protein